MIKLIGIDLDGTLLDSNKEISPANMGAINGALEKGVLVIPATGRQLVGVPEEFYSIKGVDYALTSNGAAIWKLKPDELIYRDCFSHEQAAKILSKAREYDTFISMFCGCRGYYEKNSLEKFKSRLTKPVYDYLQMSRRETPCLKTMIEENNDGIEKFSMMFVNMDEREKAAEYFLSFPEFNLSSSMPDNLEINTCTASKGQGMAFLAKRLGLDESEVMAIGDSSNDLSMIETAGLSVAMGNSEEILKEKADYVTASCDDDGVAKAIEKFVLARQ